MLQKASVQYCACTLLVTLYSPGFYIKGRIYSGKPICLAGIKFIKRTLLGAWGVAPEYIHVQGIRTCYFLKHVKLRAFVSWGWRTACSKGRGEDTCVVCSTNLSPSHALAALPVQLFHVMAETWQKCFLLLHVLFGFKVFIYGQT